MRKPDKTAATFRLTPEALRLIRRIAIENGITQAAVIELAVRDYAEKRLSVEVGRGK